MIEIPVFPHRGRVTPKGNANLEVLSALLTGGLLVENTEAGAKDRLPIACLGGPFRPLPADAQHGRCIGRCGVYGYRNTEHVNWDTRTGLVLVDVDDLADADIPAVRARFAGVDAVTALWLSASGRGFKVGIAMDPLPLNPAECRDAWGMAAMLSAALLTGIEHRPFDVTAAACQAAILAHDPLAMVRDEVAARLTWTVGDYKRACPDAREEHDMPDGYAIALSACLDVLEAANALNWAQGSRTTSLHRFGFEIGQRGWDLNLDTARMVAIRSGLMADDGEGCLNHYRRGYQSGRDTICTFFPAMGGAVW